MKLIKFHFPQNCFSGGCPSIIETDSDVVLVQGVKLSKEERESLVIPGHEDVVSIPKAVFEDLLGQYRR